MNNTQPTTHLPLKVCLALSEYTQVGANQWKLHPVDDILRLPLDLCLDKGIYFFAEKDKVAVVVTRFFKHIEVPDKQTPTHVRKELCWGPHRTVFTYSHGKPLDQFNPDVRRKSGQHEADAAILDQYRSAHSLLLLQECLSSLKKIDALPLQVKFCSFGHIVDKIEKVFNRTKESLQREVKFVADAMRSLNKTRHGERLAALHQQLRDSELVDSKGSPSS